MDIIKIKIDCQKIEKAHLYKGTKGTYLDCDLLPAKPGGKTDEWGIPVDDYKNHYMVIQQVSKEQRMAGVKGAIIGNAKIWRTAVAKAQAPQAAPTTPVDDSDVPF